MKHVPTSGNRAARPRCGAVALLFLLLVIAGRPAPAAGQMRLLAPGSSGISGAAEGHGGDAVEWLLDSSWRLAFSYRSRFDIGIRLKRAQEAQTVGEDSATELFAEWVALQPAEPAGFGIALRGAGNVQKSFSDLQTVPGFAAPHWTTDHQYRRTYRLGARLWQRPTPDAAWGIGAFCRLRQVQSRANADDSVLYGQDAFEVGLEMDLAVRILDIFTLEVAQEIGRDEVGANFGEGRWAFESRIGVGMLINLKGGNRDEP